MRKFWIGTIINVAGIYLLTFLLSVIPERAVMQNNAFLFVTLKIASIQIAIALFLLIPKETKEIAQKILAASGIVFLIGLAVGSGAINIH